MGATRRPRMTSRCSSGLVPLDLPLVLVTTSSGSLERSSWFNWGVEGHDPLWHQVREGHRVEGPGDRVTHPNPEDVHGAARAAVAGVGVVRIVAGADHRGDRPLERPEDLAHPD